MHRQASERAVPSDPVQHEPRIVFVTLKPFAIVTEVKGA
jgi:hypothetical protein